MAMAECHTCQSMHGAPLPLCMTGEATYGEMAKHLLGWRVRVTEVAYRAMGAPSCTYAFDKAVRPWEAEAAYTLRWSERAAGDAPGGDGGALRGGIGGTE